MNDKADMIEFLHKVEIFSTLTNEEIATIIEFITPLKYTKDTILFKQGDEGKEFYIIWDGKISSNILLPDGNEKTIATFGCGDFFGELILFDDAPRSATCFCENDCFLLQFSEDSFLSLIQEQPAITSKIMKEMIRIVSDRLQNTSKFLQDMVYWGEKARKRAITDEFTGAYNRRYIEENARSYYNKAKTGNEPLSVVMVDLDYFRQINENYSPKIGDLAILEVVKVFNEKLRNQDILARYGGDEFTVIMPGTGPQEAYDVIEVVRKGVESLDFFKDKEGPFENMTLSLGIACFPEHTDNPEELQKLADEALYIAKESGRNRVALLK